MDQADTYLVCSGGCGVVAPIMVGAESRCLGCGSFVAVASRRDVVSRILERAGGAFTSEEREALTDLAADAGQLKRLTQEMQEGAESEAALQRAHAKMSAILELREALLPGRTEELLRR